MIWGRYRGEGYTGSAASHQTSPRTPKTAGIQTVPESAGPLAFKTSVLSWRKTAIVPRVWWQSWAVSLRSPATRNRPSRKSQGERGSWECVRARECTCKLQAGEALHIPKANSLLCIQRSSLFFQDCPPTILNHIPARLTQLFRNPPQKWH
jgi:hypothetical protein